MKFTVDRRTWHRGKGGCFSSLLRTDGTRCCIGFVGQQCGIEDKMLRNVVEIVNVSLLVREKFPDWMRGYPGKNADSPIMKAYTVNDDPKLTDTERESQLKAIFMTHGDEIEFVN